jgi:hypothetical protein
VLEPNHKALYAVLQPSKEVSLSCHVPNFYSKLYFRNANLAKYAKVDLCYWRRDVGLR